ncbi:unnamed protein product [Sphagnum jensenii]|uniref:Pentatricopeptide repeat-containing protein n=1 Tax=Sphagnum jensenii TaxID=128206 RepID=A0ABP1AX59_9BRYO
MWEHGARRVFNKMPSQDVVTWNGILGGCAMHGHENMIKAMPCKRMWLHGWLCSVLAKSMILWKWENLLLKEFLNWSLKILLVNIANKNLCWWWQQPSP